MLKLVGRGFCRFGYDRLLREYLGENNEEVTILCEEMAVAGTKVRNSDMDEEVAAAASAKAAAALALPTGTAGTGLGFLNKLGIL